ncbi:MAG: 30S ribosomal protein S2 [Myxococcales bacterium]|nr:30S ribosomal protein S2 [Myxococcales bacterium]
MSENTEATEADIQRESFEPSEGQRIITVRQLLEAGVHFGHRTERWNPRMKPFIYGARGGIHIIDLQQTATLFRRAFSFIRGVAAEGKPILFVGTKKQAADVLTSEAERAGQYFVCSRWLGGTLTNWATIRQSIEKLRNIERMAADGTTEQMTKKEALMLDRKRAKLERNLGGIKDMSKLPGAIFVIDPVREHIAVTEANRLGIPVVAVADTNADPDSLQYVIPGNDDAIRSIKLFCTKIADACVEGSRLGKARAVNEVVEQDAPETIRVHTGGDGPKVEIVSRRTQLPAPEAAASPEEGPLGTPAQGS